YHAHLYALAYQRVRTHLVADGDDREFRLRLPVQAEVEVTREDLPSRTVVQLDDVAFGMGSDRHRISVRSGVRRIPGEALVAPRPPQPTALLMAALRTS